MYVKLALNNLLNNRFRTILTVSAITIGIAALTFFQGLEQGIKKFIYTNFTAQNPLTQLIVKPNNNNLSLISQITSGSKQIKNADIDAIKKIPHVLAVYPESSLNNIAALQINLFGQWFQTDSMIFGIPYELIENESIDPNTWNNENEPYPAIVSSKLLDLYNFTVAPTNNLPLLTKENFLGTEIQILLNHSTILNRQTTHEPLKAKIVGFSNKVNLLGISLPQKIIDQINTKYNADGDNDHYLQANIIVDSLENLDAVKNEIAKLDFKTTSSLETLERIEDYFKIFSIAFGLITAIILLVAGLMIANTFFTNISERYKDIGILRAIGATQQDIKNIFLTEAAFIGLSSGIAGIFIGIVSSIFANQVMLNLLTNLTLKPSSFFEYHPLILLVILVFAVIFSLAFAYVPSTKAAKLEPLQAINR